MSFTTIGTVTPRKDGIGKVTGAERFTQDITLPGMWSALCLRSPHPHAKIVAIDTSEAEAMGAVVLTPDDVPDLFYNERTVSVPACTYRDRRVLPRVARHVGEPIAAVAAPNEELAFRALCALKVDYQVLPAVLDPVAAQSPANPSLYQEIFFGDEVVIVKNNIACQRQITVGDAFQALAQSDFVFERNYFLPRVYHHQMETKSAVVRPDPDGGVTVWCTTQSIHNVRHLIARIFSLPMSKVKVKKTPLGGSFGSSIQMNTVIPICAALALKAMKPVKLVSSREEDCYSHTNYPSQIHLKVGVNGDMTIQGVIADVLVDIGAHQIQAYPYLGSICGWMVSLYKWKNIQYEGKAIYTNKVPTCAMQGYGNPQMNFAVESLIDEIANHCGFDPIEFRLLNYVGAGDEFWGQGPTVRSIIKSCGVEETLRKGAELIGWDRRQMPEVKNGRYRGGIGLARGFHTSGAGAPLPAEVVDLSSATVKVNEDGSLDVITPLQDLGGGTNDAHAKIAAEVFQVPLDKVGLSAVDTTTTCYDVCTHASRGTYVGGAAVLQAAQQAKTMILDFAGRLLGEFPQQLEMVFDSKLEETVVQSIGSNVKQISIAEVARMAMVNGWGTAMGSVSYRQKNCPPSFVANFVEVELDTLTGIIHITRAVSLADCGTPINPDLAAGQLEGSLMRYGGYALSEETENHPDSGALLCQGFITDNKIFSANEMPYIKDFQTYFANTYEPSGPFGAKGLGEAAGNSVASAIANAIFNAIGIRFTRLPITPERVLQALCERKGDQ